MIARRPSSACATARDRQAGVTLVEVLVVLVLVGVMASAVGLGIGSLDRGRGAEREATLLAARLDRSAEYSLLSGQPTALDWSETGYRFRAFGKEDRGQTASLTSGTGKDGWGPHPMAALAQRHPLPAGLRLTGGGDNRTLEGRYVMSPDMLPAGDGPLRLAILQDGQSANAARIVSHDGATARISVPGASR